LKKSKPGPPSWQANFLPPKRIMWEGETV
jgi:hypothetical protein